MLALPPCPCLDMAKASFKNILNGEKGPRTKDLTLYNVAVVENFHMNIVSEAQLREKGLWYSGFNCTIRKANLVFLE